MTINQAITLANKMLSKHSELKYWNASTNNRKRSFGVCNYTKKQIELSSYLIPVMTNKGIKETIIHEIAHALTPGHNHDKVWKLKCIELGGTGQRCGGSEKYMDGEKGRKLAQQKMAKYTLTCPECGAIYHKNRKPTVDSSCGKHGRGYNPKYKLIIYQNY